MPDPLVAGGAADAQAARLADAVGFRYKYDDKSKQFAHAAVAFVLTPEGTISRYLYGVTSSRATCASPWWRPAAAGWAPPSIGC